MRWNRLVIALVASSLSAFGGPASADSAHSTMNLDCVVTPATAGVPASHSWCQQFTDFGTSAADRVDAFDIAMPVGTVLNEEGAHDAPDPMDGELVGLFAYTGEFAYNLCDDNSADGGTYSTYWEKRSDWVPYSEAGWTKVAQYHTVFYVPGIFTELLPSHVLRSDTSGQYMIVVDLPESRVCAISRSSICYGLYGYASNNSSRPWVIKTPSVSGTYTTTAVATEVGGTAHSDSDTFTVT